MSRTELFFSRISQFFTAKKTQWWVKFFLKTQVAAHALLIIALIVDGQYMQTHRWLEPWLVAWYIVYSPLNLALGLIQFHTTGPSYFSPLAFFPWVGPVVLIYPYSLVLGGITAYIDRLNPRIKRPVLVLMPLLLALGLRMYHVSTPQYAFNTFFVAVSSEDTKTAKQLTTLRFVAQHTNTPEYPFSGNKLWQKKIQHVIQEIWQRPDSTHADITYKMSDGSYYRYFLLKTAEGWKIDEFVCGAGANQAD